MDSFNILDEWLLLNIRVLIHVGKLKISLNFPLAILAVSSQIDIGFMPDAEGFSGKFSAFSS